MWISKANRQFLQGPGPHLQDESTVVFLCPASFNSAQYSTSWKRATVIGSTSHKPSSGLRGKGTLWMTVPYDRREWERSTSPAENHASGTRRRGKWLWAGRHRCSLWLNPGSRGSLQICASSSSSDGAHRDRTVKWTIQKLCAQPSCQPQELVNFFSAQTGFILVSVTCN